MSHHPTTGRSAADLRHFPARVVDREHLPPLPVPRGAVRRRQVAGEADRAAVDLARARHDALVCLDAWSLTSRAVDGVRLVVSELMTHALRHERAVRLDVELIDQRDHVTVVVEFRGTAAVDADTAVSPVAPSQLGLTVVGRVAERWGRVTSGTSGRLWAEVAAPRTRPVADRAVGPGSAPAASAAAPAAATTGRGGRVGRDPAGG